MLEDKTIVISLGGNAISQQFEEGNIYEQFANTRKSLQGVVDLIEMGYQVLITHGNGPQVGDELIRVEMARNEVPPMPLGVIVAETEGGMGYMISQCLQNLMYDRNIKKQVVAIVTQVEVDKNDPSMKDPTKFVGPFFKEEEVSGLVEERGWIVKEDPGRGWRRVVPSPKPLNIIEKDIIKNLLENNFIVIAGGGGGIPVYIEANGWLEGIDGVIDKDLSSAVLAKDIAAKELLILTGVEKVALNFGKPDQRELDRMTVDEALRYLAQGHFPPGSMGPKIEASINFLEHGGERVIITSIEKSVDAMAGKAGTIITAA